MDKILVPIDGSSSSEKALLEAKELGSRCRSSQVTILNVMRPMRGLTHIQYESNFSDIEERIIGNSKKLLEDSLKEFEGYPGEVDIMSKKGDPAKEILEIAEEGGYDAIVMGNQGQGKFSRALLGSVSNKVVNHAKMNVIIVK